MDTGLDPFSMKELPHLVPPGLVRILQDNRENVVGYELIIVGKRYYDSRHIIQPRQIMIPYPAPLKKVPGKFLKLLKCDGSTDIIKPVIVAK